MYDRILVPTDGSDVAEAAVDHALDLAEKYDAEVHALYVVDIDSVNISLGTEQVDRIKQGRFDEMDELKEQAEAATGVVADRGAERDVDVVEHVAGGRPHKVIADYAENHDIDIIVMGSHGRAGVRRALLGSVTERTLRSTHVPVLVVDYLDED
ncbi:universal stress protein [Halorubrum ezzemoulense]|jgi:nucleotide-binding universal stress UspA family protein|uniref:Universal stress protein n=1 Tax=Halorubrum ezzemoulense TaxID=337243 RepID=A0A256K6L0_HALEZ|nr:MULTISPECIES: universal stress protein [Halorubrum]MDB2225506.1 universal stress protein [Halorubrum ezzemoulense]MDB2237166.1 universal stress protein [Halorubrum ezzemoulense]MDB2241643.1 universal stress protein [Halorubrum ezzemoulense]MDB2245536.1 universal stress protein [Halorubrum ezzemoulense]MDB2246884.1 universal stress protein [Halorubrum ezzemoulense]